MVPCLYILFVLWMPYMLLCSVNAGYAAYALYALYALYAVCAACVVHAVYAVRLPGSRFYRQGRRSEVHRMGGGWGLGGAGAGLTEVPSPRSRDCSTLRLRPVAVGSVAAAKYQLTSEESCFK